MAVNSFTLHVNERGELELESRIIEEIPNYKFRPKRPSSRRFLFRLVCKTQTNKKKTKPKNHSEMLRGCAQHRIIL